MSVESNRPGRRGHGAASVYWDSAVGRNEASRRQRPCDYYPRRCSWPTSNVISSGALFFLILVFFSNPSTPYSVRLYARTGDECATENIRPGSLASSTAAGVQRRGEADPRLRQIFAGAEGPAQETEVQGHGSVQVPSLQPWIREDPKPEKTLPKLRRLERQP